MSGYIRWRRHWQYRSAKEVIAVHEVVNPYDWQLDIEINENFKLWQKQLDNA